MLSSLDELIVQVRCALPHPESIRNVCYQPVLEGLTFEWFGTSFFAKNNGEIFEVRGTTLYVTGNSMLLQSIVTYASDRHNLLLELSNALDCAGELLGRPRHLDQVLELLQNARASLSKFVAQPVRQATGNCAGTPIGRV